MNNKICWLAGLIVFLFSCSNNSDIPENPLFINMESTDTGVTFSNEISPSQDFNIFNYRNFYNGGGVAIGDINNDGLVDLYFTSNQAENKLYLNEGNFKFTDITESAGVAGSRPWTTGVTMADVNGDGLLDIYVLNSADIEENNRQNELFINQGNLTFTEEAEKYNLDDNAFSVHASFFDYDQDGDLDCYLVNNRFKGTGEDMRQLLSQTREEVDEQGGDKLFRNDGGKFTDVSQEAGIYQGAIGFGLGAIVGDFNLDNHLDIYVSNDFWERDYLYINQGDGTFSEEVVQRTSHISQSSMGSDIGDINNDGGIDIFTTDMLPTDVARIKTMTVFDDYHFEDMDYHGSFHYQYLHNTLLLNNRNGTFSEISFLSGVAATDWSWGALLFDFTNNGWIDIFVSNGVYKDITDKDFRNFIRDRTNIARIVREEGEFNILNFLERLPSQKIKNSGFTNNKDKTFTNRSDSLGFYEPTFSNGAAYGDLDNDGDLDLVVNNLNGEASVFRNSTEQYQDSHYLKLKFQGNGKNPFGIGAQVKLYVNGMQQVGENITSRGFQSSVPAEVHFGLGENTLVDSLIVMWPDNRMEVLKNIEVDQEITVKHSSASERFELKQEKNRQPIIEEVTDAMISSDIAHVENNYIDFEENSLLPHMLSNRGPKLAKGDINGDGLEDLYVGSSTTGIDKLFIQKSDGMLAPSISSALTQDGRYESTAAEFFDMDSDGDLDLMVGNGGNQFELGSTHNRLRVYENDGNGNFTSIKDGMPDVRINAATIQAEDFDNDGDMDVFIGARAIPKEYGADPRSYLLQNNGDGTFVDITPNELKQAGMITDAIWTDYDADGDQDLMVVGEWMPIIFYKNNDGNIELDFSLENSNGWWSALKASDLDGDGDMDYVLGNWGLNSKFRATPERPITMYVNDFDSNGNSEFIINTYQPGDDKAYPFPTYNDLIKEIPFLRERIPNHHTYADMTYEQIFTSAQRERAIKKEVQTLHTAILINNDGQFELRNLPIEAQVSPVYSIIAEDFNDDERTDLLLLGNQHGLKPEVGRLADNYGIFLINRGQLNFEFMPYDQTGTFIRGEVRDTEVITIGGEKYFIIARNNDELMIFR